MDVSAVLKPQAGWYSSHWSIAPASILTRPFTVASSGQVQQPLAGLHDLYSRAVFLLGVAGGLPGNLPGTPAPKPSAAPQGEKGMEVSEPGPAREARPAALSRKPLPSEERKNIRPPGLAKAEPVEIFSQEAPGPIASPASPDPGLAPQAAQGETTPENPEKITAKAEVLVEAVNRLAAALEAHDFLAPSLREYGADLVNRFAASLAPIGLSDAGGSLALDGEQLARASQENPDQVAEALWGQNSLTPELTSLAAAIVGAPGIFLVQAAHPAPETYQPFQPPNPWFRVAPANFHQVA
jgi:hypothetical protein